jgi:signal transduction histidine kinase
MIQRQLPVCCQTSARDSVMPHIAHPDDNGPQPDRGEHCRFEGVLDTALGDRSAAEQRAYATQRLAALGEMTGGIAHDFRNLFAVIELGLRLAEKSLEQPEKVRVYIAAARGGIDRGVKLTSQLLAFAKRQELEARLLFPSVEPDGPVAERRSGTRTCSSAMIVQR